MECGIKNGTDRDLKVTVNGTEHLIARFDGVYIDVPEDKKIIIEVEEEEKDIKKFRKFLYAFLCLLLAPIVVIKKAESLEMKQSIGLTTRFEVTPSERISLVPNEEDFSICCVATENRVYNGEMVYTAEELKKKTFDFIVPALMTLIGAAGYLLLIVAFVKKNRLQLMGIVAGAAALPIVFLAYNMFRSYRQLKQRLDSSDETDIDE